MNRRAKAYVPELCCTYGDAHGRASPDCANTNTVLSLRWDLHFTALELSCASLSLSIQTRLLPFEHLF